MVYDRPPHPSLCSGRSRLFCTRVLEDEPAPRVRASGGRRDLELNPPPSYLLLLLLLLSLLKCVCNGHRVCLLLLLLLLHGDGGSSSRSGAGMCRRKNSVD